METPAIVLLGDNHAIDRAVPVVDGLPPAYVRIPVLHNNGFHSRRAVLTGRRDLQGRLVYDINGYLQ